MTSSPLAGTPAPGLSTLTVAWNDTSCPNTELLGDAATAVLVLAWPTVKPPASELVLVANLESPE